MGVKENHRGVTSRSLAFTATLFMNERLLLPNCILCKLRKFDASSRLVFRVLQSKVLQFTFPNLVPYCVLLFSN